MVISVIKKYFNPKVNQASPVIGEFGRVVETDEHGAEYISYQPVDCQKIIKSNGSVKEWKLDALLKAGISPEAMSVRTGNVTRLEGVDTIRSIESDLDAFIAESKVKNEE